LADSDLVNICQSVNRPERQRGLLLRRVDPKRTLPRSKMQSYFVGDGSHMQHAPGQPSPTSPTDMLGVYLPSTAIEPPASAPSSPDPLDGDVATSLIADQYSPDRRGSKMNRASTVSVMSGLLDWNTTNQTRSPSLSTALSNGTTRLRHFFGHRPPSELIASHLTDYFPSAEKKLLTKTIRNSVRKSVAPRPRSQFANWDANSSRFSISSAGSSGTAGGLEPPPPLPSKEGNEHFAAVPLNHENSRWSRMPTSGSGSSLDEEGDSDNLPKDTAAVLDSLDDDSMGVRRSKSRQSQSSRMSSRLSIKTSKSFGKDSDNASLLTVDEITAEVEHRRMSMASTWTSAGPAIHVADESEYSAGDDRSRSSRSSISSERESEEEESETDEDDEVDEDDLAPEKVTSTGSECFFEGVRAAHATHQPKIKSNGSREL
jgi:mitogen-activated protein kinase kinase kinase